MAKVIDCKVWNDWEGLLMPWTVHWVDFTIIQAKAEWDKRFGNAELHLALLGMHFMIVVNLGKGDVEFQEELKDMMKELGLDGE